MTHGTEVFVDTSALVALLNADEQEHKAVSQEWERLIHADASLVTSNYVVTETHALVQRRMGLQAAEDLHNVVLPLMQTVWVDETAHNESVAVVLRSGRRELSLVDCVSFTMMRRLSIRWAFSLDAHFAGQGFQLVPQHDPAP